jgi:hypothetical protein
MKSVPHLPLFQVVVAKRFGDKLFRLASQNSEIGIPSLYPITIFKVPRINSFDDEFSAHAIFCLGGNFAEGCTLFIPFAIVCDI